MSLVMFCAVAAATAAPLRGSPNEVGRGWSEGAPLAEGRGYELPRPDAPVPGFRVRRADLADHLSAQLAGADLQSKASDDERRGKPLVKRQRRHQTSPAPPRWPTSPEWQDHASMFGASLLLFFMSGVLGICRRLPEEPPDAGEAALGLLPPPPLLFLAQILRRRR